MALTITALKPVQVGGAGVKTKVFDVTFDDSYPTGGEALTAAQLGVSTIHYVSPGVAPAGAAGTTAVCCAYDYTNHKLQAFWVPALDGDSAEAQALAQVDSTTDLSTYTFRVLVVGV